MRFPWLAPVLALVALLSTTASAHGGGDLLGLSVASSVRASLEVTSRLTTAATTAETSCKRGDERCRECAWKSCWCETLPLDVADRLLREAYAFDGPTLRQVATSLGVPPRELAAAIVRHTPTKPTETELSHLLVLAAG